MTTRSCLIAPVAFLPTLTLFLLIATARPVQGYELRTNGSGDVLIWKQSQVTVVIDTSSAPERARDADAVRAGFVVWTSSGVPTRVVFQSADSPARVGNDGKNCVVWERDDWSFGQEVVGTTVSTYNRDTGFVVDSDVVFNAVNHEWTNTPEAGGSAYDVQNVTAHEAGHFFGLGHEASDAEATMYPTTPPCETKKRSLADDDIAGVVALVEEIQRRTGTGDDGTGESGTEQASRKDGSGLVPPRTELAGCSAGRSPGGWLAVALLMVGFWICRRRGAARLTGVVVAVALLGAGSAARATVMEGLTLDQLTDRSQVVVRGKLVSSRPVRVGRLVFTEHTLAGVSCLKGSCSQTVQVRTAGGDLGNGLAMHVDGVADLHSGAEVVLFLQRRGASGLRTVALSQGAFHLQNGVAVRDLRKMGLIVRHEGVRRVVHGELQTLPIGELENRVRARVGGTVGAALDSGGLRLRPSPSVEGVRLKTVPQTSQIAEPSSGLRRLVGPFGSSLPPASPGSAPAVSPRADGTSM